MIGAKLGGQTNPMLSSRAAKTDPATGPSRSRGSITSSKTPPRQHAEASYRRLAVLCRIADIRDIRALNVCKANCCAAMKSGYRPRSNGMAALGTLTRGPGPRSIRPAVGSPACAEDAGSRHILVHVCVLAISQRSPPLRPQFAAVAMSRSLQPVPDWATTRSSLDHASRQARALPNMSTTALP